MKILHGHVKFQLNSGQVSKAVRVLNRSNKPRVYIAGKVYEQKIVGRLVGRRKARKVGSFPELPGSITLLRARRLKEIARHLGVAGILAKVFVTK